MLPIRWPPTISSKVRNLVLGRDSGATSRREPPHQPVHDRTRRLAIGSARHVEHAAVAGVHDDRDAKVTAPLTDYNLQVEVVAFLDEQIETAAAEQACLNVFRIDAEREMDHLEIRIDFEHLPRREQGSLDG